MQWSELREQVTTSLLSDTNERWTPEQLRDYCGWALDALCDHTAVATSTEYEGDGTTKTFDLPGNLYGKLLQNGYVYRERNAVYQPYHPSPTPTTAELRFWTRPDKVLHVGQAPRQGDILRVDHYAMYPHPATDTDSLDLVPNELIAALCYRIAAHAFSPRAVRSSNIDQYKRSRDKGNPEDNTWSERTIRFMDLYYQELDSHPRQDRTQHRRKRRGH